MPQQTAAPDTRKCFVLRLYKVSLSRTAQTNAEEKAFADKHNLDVRLDDENGCSINSQRLHHFLLFKLVPNLKSNFEAISPSMRKHQENYSQSFTSWVEMVNAQIELTDLLRDLDRAFNFYNPKR